MPDIDILAPEKLVLETERLLLRPLSLDDLELGIQLLSDPDVVRYVCEPKSEAYIKERHPRRCTRGAGGRIGVWSITELSSGQKIGTGVLLPIPIELDNTDWDQVRMDRYPDGPIEVGYLFKPAAWGKGYATEVCKRLVDFAFEETSLDKIVACTAKDNAASQNVLKKSGLKDLGMQPAYATECPFFRITRSEWAE